VQIVGDVVSPIFSRAGLAHGLRVTWAGRRGKQLEAASCSTSPTLVQDPCLTLDDEFASGAKVGCDYRTPVGIRLEN